MKRDVKQPGPPPGAADGVRPERFSGDPIGMDDSGHLFPVSEATVPATEGAKALKKKSKR